MEENTALIPTEVKAIPVSVSPKKMLDLAAEQATALAKLIEDRGLYVTIRKKKFVKVEGWLPLARMNGVIPREISVVEHPEGVFTATVALVRIEDGVVLTQASMECGSPDETYIDDEGKEIPIWASRPRYARRSMAITRATGKACRLAYSWIMELAGYSPTPAEEMPHEKEESSDDIPDFKPTYTKSAYNNGPNTMWNFTSKYGKKAKTIGVVEGDLFTPEFLKASGLHKAKDGKWYADYSEDLQNHLVTRLKGEL